MSHPPAPNGGVAQPKPPSLTGRSQQASANRQESTDRNARGTIRDTQLYKRILTQSLKQEGLEIQSPQDSKSSSSKPPQPGQPPHVVPPKSSEGQIVSTDPSSPKGLRLAGLSDEQSDTLVRQVAEMAATAAAVAAQNAARTPLRRASTSRNDNQHRTKSIAPHTPATGHEDHNLAGGAEPAAGGHDAPNWSRLKSFVILLGATVLYAVIAEILVNTVDVVLENVDIDEKFLGITLFALVPNTTEFLVSLYPVRSVISGTEPIN